MDSYRFSRVAGRWFSKSTKLLGGLPAANERSDWAVAHQRAKRPIVSYRNRYAALCCQSDLCLDQAHVSLSTLLVIWRSPQDWQHVLRYVPSFWKLALLPVRTFFFFFHAMPSCRGSCFKLQLSTIAILNVSRSRLRILLT